jgi:hypothetical protein
MTRHLRAALTALGHHPYLTVLAVIFAVVVAVTGMDFASSPETLTLYPPAPTATASPALSGQMPPPVTASPAASEPAPPSSPAPQPPPLPSTSPPPSPASCFPTTATGNCYEPGELCRKADHGITGTAGDGKRITCEDNDGWRWEPV